MIKLFIVSALILCCYTTHAGKYLQPLQKEAGKYFSKKEYIDTDLPKFNSVRDQIPAPVLTENPGWVDLYWKTWEIGFAHIKKPPEGSPFVSNYWDEAFSPAIFQWDAIFCILFGRYIHHIIPAIGSLDNFYSRQRVDGFISRENMEKNGREGFFRSQDDAIGAPLFAWAEIEWYRITADKNRYKMVLPVLEKYAAWLEKNRIKKNTKHGLYWNSVLGSGMDESPRQGSGWIDMSCQVQMLYQDLASMCRVLNKKKKAKKFEKKVRFISHAINKWMWDAKEQIYLDIDNNGKPFRHKTIACFWPLLAGTSNRERSAALVGHLYNPDEFWRNHPFPALSADHELYAPDGGYWRGGSWPPTNYMVIKGLEKQGYHDLAREASRRILAGMYQVYMDTKTIWEFYAPDFYLPGKKKTPGRIKAGRKPKDLIAKPDFVGWSGLGPVALLIENIIGIECNAPENLIIWRLNRMDRHGITKLRMAANSIDLICNERNFQADPAIITVKSQKPFTLKVIHPGGTRVFEVKKKEESLMAP
jgi:hypothetical protein